MTTRDVSGCAAYAALALGLLLGAACNGKSDKSTAATDAAVSSAVGDASTGTAATDAATTPSAGDAAAVEVCPTPAPNQPPDSLSCTGLYGDIEKKLLAKGVEAYAPAVPLWSDGAEKARWIYLPAGKKIDVSNPDSWRFPVGTKLWKEFKLGGKRVETRMFWKLSATFWARTAYQWNAAETEATRTGGADVQVGGHTYHIPSTTECDQCHKGRLDRALGFETLLLGLPGATGLNLAALRSKGLLSGGTLPSSFEIGDDGTGHASAALAWMHVNCGVSCHNGNSAAEAYSTGLRLDLDVANADGSPVNGFEPLTTTLNVKATTGRWLGRVRIVPGAPEQSLLYSLMSTRNPTNMKDQMPPIASRVVPADAAKLIKDWISAMGTSASDAGM